jgi:hypothetical protein
MQRLASPGYDCNGNGSIFPAAKLSHKWKYMYEFEQFYIYANHSSPLKANCPLIWRGTSTLLDLL